MILDGKQMAEQLRLQIRERALAFAATAGRPPGLDVVLVGEDPASAVYTRNKEKAAKDAGFRGALHKLPADATEAQVLALVDTLNADPAVDGILVQLPLPKGLDERNVLLRIDPAKDVDGFHPINAGRLASGMPGLVPCTPKGCMHLARATGVKLDGLHAVVLGRSNIVGKPIAQLLLAANCTVTIAHSKSKDLPAICRGADVLIAAVGRPEMVRGDWIKPGAIVIDVGINRVPHQVPGDGEKTRLVGDVHFAEAQNVAGFITPVPGGVGPMTIACLLENTLEAAALRGVARRS
jgi:methylenetetrahydrofolate dehydrogenase (NADP+) / methenyltetrahydrofolate cyclohydrolase